MLMAFGPFRFTVPTYSVETLRRSVQPRVEAQPVIGALPRLHRLGPANEQISLSSTFHPHHLNGQGLSQLSGVRQVVNALQPMMLTHIDGSRPNVFGLWIATGLEDESTLFDPSGKPSQVTTTLTLLQYGGGAASARAIAMGVVAGSLGVGAGGLSVNGSISFGGVNVSAGIKIGF
jgi:phage protein U